MATLNLGGPAPDFTLTDLQGQTLQLSALRGTPVILNFFDSACPWCQVEMPKLSVVYRRHADLNVHIIGVVVGRDDETSAARFAEEHQLDIRLAVDNHHTVREAYGLERIPAIVSVDAAGHVARLYEGSAEQLSGVVEQTILAAARSDELPAYQLVGNGCEP